MTGHDHGAQLATVGRAIEVGINWFDTAAGYGDGQSEANLGRVLAELHADEVHIATKVRVPIEAFDRIHEYIRQSVTTSLERLRRPRITLLQIHNGITFERGDEPASITPADALGPVAEAFRALQNEGLVRHVGLTGTGDAQALHTVVREGVYETLQVPFNILNASAGGTSPSADGETDYGNIISDCVTCGLGVFAIRVLAGGALLGQPPSAHTLRTLFFPLPLFERDARRADRLARLLGDRVSMLELGIRFALSHPGVSSALVGFGSVEHIDLVARCDLGQPMPDDLVRQAPRRF
jgi:aryl-alcohol dehydrogenase-like predicted oxidoreductase